MAVINGGATSFFTEETYQAFLQKQNYVHNERLRGENETIFDAALSEEADFTKHPEGAEIIETIRSYH